MSGSKKKIADYLNQQATLDLLKFITCGSVDDGKSTLIGRLLYEAQLIFEDQIAVLKSDSKRHGTQHDEIDFALLVFTNNQLGTTIAEEHESGVEVNGIIEQINTEGSEYDFLVEEGVNVISHQGFGDSFHHKYCIVDHDNTDSDPLVITGSHNWSGAAETNNDENTMIIHDANIANQFFQEFNERMNEIENQVEPSFNCVGEACIDPMDGSGTYSSLVACEYVCSPASIHELVQGNIQVYPNPNEGKFTIQINSLISTTLKYRISDLQGKIVVENKVNLLKGINKLEINENITTGFYFVEMANERIKIIVQ